MTSEAPLQIGYTMAPDENGVFDGRDLAEELIRDAYKLLVPYTGGCAGCSPALFTVIANEVIDELVADGSPKGIMMGTHGDVVETEQAFFEHRAETKEKTMTLLRKGGLKEKGA
jgi:hypothetical protein